MRYPKRSQYKCAKSRYRIRNWPEYEVGLRNRGDLTVWLSDATLDAWRAPASGRPGGQRTYSDLAIEAALTIRMILDRPIHLLIDSTGFRIHVGHLRKPPKRRVWRKLHLAVNADTGSSLLPN
jgi:hypothetical protein